MSVKSAIVVGGGIGGLTAALALSYKGLRGTLVEQTAEFGEVGAGIQVSPNASRELIGLGLEASLRDRAFLPEAVEMRTWKRGHRLMLLPLRTEIEKRFGAPFLHLHRSDLHAVLADAAEASADIEWHLGATCRRVDQDAGHATVMLTDGRELSADIVIGADGIKSAVRASLFGAEAPRFTGCVAWRGVVPAESVRDGDVRPVAANWMGPGAHFVHYYLRRGELVNFVAVVEKTGWETESWTEHGEKSELLADFAGWHPTVQSLIGAADPDACFKWALHDRNPLARWTQGRTTLLGDACHPTLPFMAQGACMAIEDAAVLAECLSAADDVPAALVRYEGLRRPRCTGIQLGSRNNQTLYHLSGAKAWLRNVAMPFGRKRLEASTGNLYSYDAASAAKVRS